MSELIVPRLYRIVKIDKDTNTTVEEEIEISGRKVPLLCIRQNLQKKFLDAGIVRYATLNIPNLSKDEISKVLTELDRSFNPTDSEESLKRLLVDSITERNLMFWIDHSSILSHGHLLMTVKVIYDKRFFLTDEEVSGTLNVQQFVEDPEIYMLTRCRDTLADKFMYSESRLEDIFATDENIKDDTNNLEIHDKIRYFNGDHPELQSESGQQIGGNYPCNGCEVPASEFKNLAKGFDGHYRSIEERYNLVS